MMKSRDKSQIHVENVRDVHMNCSCCDTSQNFLHMYGTMQQSATNKQPLLAESNDRYQGDQIPIGTTSGATATVAATTTTTAAGNGSRRDGLVRAPSARNGPVLAFILDKSHNQKKHSDVPVPVVSTSNLELTGEHTLATLPPRPKSFVYTMLNPRSDAWQAVVYKGFIAVVIISDLVSFVISTEPNLSDYHRRVFHMWEGVTSTIFLVEYITRLVVVTESQKYYEQGPFWGRVSYALTWSALIDFLATFPFFAELATGWDLPTLTYLRSFRLLRIFKTSGFSEATRAVYRVIYYNRQILYVALLICVGLILLTAVLMYYLRPQDPEHSQDFQSLGATMYLSTLMLTGQGGPEGDMPWYTKGVVLLTGIFSIGMFAIPASMLTWGFEAEAERMAQVAYAKRRQPQTNAEQDNWSFSSEDYSTDEEYVRIIAGGDGEEDEDAEARKTFTLADIDGSGTISLSEYLALSRNQAAGANAGKSSIAVDQELTARLDVLEKRIENNSQKLDKICRLLEGMQVKS